VRAGAKPRTGGRAYLGLALLGWGLSILLGVTPHEDLLVGAALATFGFVLLFTAPPLPRVGHLRPWIVASAGVGIAILVLAYDEWAQSALNLPKAAIVAFGCMAAATAPWLDREVATGRRGVKTTVATLLVCALAVLGGPLLMWTAQAAFKAGLGTTPTEAFVRTALLAPVGALLTLFGWHPTTTGQTITYLTPRGPFSLEIGAACSGVQAMALFTGVLALFMWSERPGARRFALWSAIGIAGVYVANLLRIVMLFLVGYQWGSEAVIRAHAQAGWIFFVGWALLFALLVRKTRAQPPARPPLRPRPLVPGSTLGSAAKDRLRNADGQRPQPLPGPRPVRGRDFALGSGGLRRAVPARSPMLGRAAVPSAHSRTHDVPDVHARGAWQDTSAGLDGHDRRPRQPGHVLSLGSQPTRQPARESGPR
jgi:exosortase/archaeosortase family protein